MWSLIELAYVIARRRVLSNWRLEAVLFVGILLAVALLSSGVVFSSLLAESALRRTLNQASADEVNFSMRVFHGLYDPSVVPRADSEYQRGLNYADNRVGAVFQPYLRDRSHLLETATFFYEGHPQLGLDQDVRPRGKFQYLMGLSLEEHPGRVKVIEGLWPQYTVRAGRPDSAEPLEVAIDTEGARLLELGVGDEMAVFPGSRAEEREPMRVQIVAIFSRVEPDDDFWYGYGDTFSYRGDQWSTVPLFTTEKGILESVGWMYPGLHSEVTWHFYSDPEGINAGDVGTLRNALRGLRFDARANLRNSSVTTKLEKVLGDYEDELLLARIPLFLMLFLVTGILIYYLALVTGLIVRSRANEISVLKSRGITTPQIGLLALVEGLLLSVPAVALGPLIALGVSRALGEFFFDVHVGTADLPLALGADAFLLGGAGAIAAVGVLTIATVVASRQGIVEFRQSGARPPTAPFIHRYYLDLWALILIGLIWWQIKTRGSFLVRSLGTGDLEIDFTLLVGPVLGLLALGLMVMRAFPLAVAVLARIAGPLGPAWLAQGLRRVSRDPIMPGTLIVLLMLATALGVIGSALSSTFERSQRDRALYAAGADLRIEHEGGDAPIPLLGLSDLAEEFEGVTTVAEVNRARGTILSGGFSSIRVSVLAVDSRNFQDVAWYRPDFAGGKSLEELSATLTSGSPEGEGNGIELPRDTNALRIWVHPGHGLGSFLRARLQDANGYYFDTDFGRLDFQGWRHLDAPLEPSAFSAGGPRSRTRLPVSVKPPFTLLSLHIFRRFGAGDPAVLFVDRLTAFTREGEHTIADFETLDTWHVIEDYSNPGLYALESSESVIRTPGGSTAAFSWAPASTASVRGIRPGDPETPVPAVVSNSFLDAAGATLGDTVTVSMSGIPVLVKTVAAAEFFPTMDSRNEPFAVVDLRALNRYTAIHSLRLVGGSNELWIGLEDPLRVPTGLLEALEQRDLPAREVLLASEMVSQRVEQPLVNAQWGGLLVLMFLALVLASSSGVMLFSYMDTLERRTEYALLRTMGLSKGQLNGVVWFNLFVVVAGGIGLGTWAGHEIGRGLLPILEIAEEGVRVTPPMVLQTNWVTLLASYLVLAAVTAGTVAWLAWITAKLEVQGVLRIGEA